MARALSPVRVARIGRLSFQAARETVELDFQLGLLQGVNVLSAEFILGNAVLVPTSVMVAHSIHSSLHLEVGSLEEDASNLAADGNVLNSEIIADVVINVAGQDEADVQYEVQPHHDLL